MFRPNPGKANFPPVEELQTEIRSALRQSADPAVMRGFSLSRGSGWLGHVTVGTQRKQPGPWVYRT